MSYNYQTAPVAYPVYNQMSGTNLNYSVSSYAVNAGVTGAIVGAVAGAAQGVYQTQNQEQGRAMSVAKVAAVDSALCGASSFAGAVAAGMSGTRGWLSLAVFAAAGIGTGYMLQKVLPKAGCSSCDDSTE